MTTQVRRTDELISQKDTDEIVKIATDVGMMIIFLSFVMAKITPTLVQASNYFTSQSYQGGLIESLVSVDEYPYFLDILNTPPYVPWISADFMNAGPSRIYVAVNTPDNWKIVEVGEAYTFDVLGATQRIDKLYYKTDAGSNSSSARVTGRY